jgi:DNA polymerase-1
MDTLLADYLRDAAAKHGLDVMADRDYGIRPTLFSDLVGKAKDGKASTFSEVPLEQAAHYCGMDVHLTRKLAIDLNKQLGELGPKLPELLSKVELPLEPVLAVMEATGIRIDVPYLAGLSSEIGATLEQLESKAKEVAEVDFNLASPKQLGELLFNTLGLDRKKITSHQNRLQHRCHRAREAGTGSPRCAPRTRTSGAEQIKEHLC